MDGGTTGAPPRFEVLGPLRAYRDGQELDLGPGKQRAVLAVLILAGGRPVAVDSIVDAVWRDAPPGNGANVVQKHVAGLRRILEPQRSPRSPGQLITLTDGGYRLRVDDDTVDANRFAELVRQARAQRGSQPAQSLQLLTQAIGLHRGQPLAGLAGGYFDGERERLRDGRADAEELRAELVIELGRAAETVADLTRLVAEFPAREQPRYLLMLALYQSDRQAEALAAYRAAHNHLADEYGVVPGERLRTLHQQILHADPVLAAPPAVHLPPAPQVPLAAELPFRSSPVVATVVEPPPLPTPMPVSSLSAPHVPTNPKAADPPPMPPPRLPAQLTPSQRQAGQLDSGQLETSQLGADQYGAGQFGAAGFGPAGNLLAVPPWGVSPGGLVLYSGLSPRATRSRPSMTVRVLAAIGAAMVCVCSVGFLTWLIFGALALWRRRWWLLWSCLGYIALLVVVFAEISAPDTPGFSRTDVGGIAVMLCMFGGAGHAFGAALVWEHPGRRTEQRERRKDARAVLARSPQLARDLRIGRPDLPRWYDDGFLVDVNSAPLALLASLPALGPVRAQRIVADRLTNGPVATVDELAHRGAVDAPVLARLRDTLIAVPAWIPQTGPSAAVSPTALLR